METITQTDLCCYHCGQPCGETLWLDDKPFCCTGCRTVYEILSENDLCTYYTLDKAPGVRQTETDTSVYACLDDPAVRSRFLEFDSPNFARARFVIPAIHCVSCIWLLENLRKLEPGILRSEVNYAHKSVVIDFNPTQVSLSRIAQRAATLGYAPQISLDAGTQKPKGANQQLILKLTVAAFCFGNVMLFSFPEYLGLDAADLALQEVFSWLNLALSIPVFLYSGSDYLRSAVTAFTQRRINIDVPIALGLVALMARSTWDIVTATGPGYFDSLTGLVFFLLVGRWFQGKTYESLAFDRDFKSYFPLAVERADGANWRPVVVHEIREGDTIRIRNGEIVPADSRLLDERALIDYSFVTGESAPVEVRAGDLIYAGGRLVGVPVRMTVDRKIAQSYLTSLWNNQVFQKDTKDYRSVMDKIATRFTWAVVIIAVGTAIAWSLKDSSQVWLNVTAVLIVACPCALALTAPFTYGNMMRVFGRAGLYLKNAHVIERMAKTDAIVFDKTGTVTHGKEKATFTGVLDQNELSWVKSLAACSTHPLSRIVYTSLSESRPITVDSFSEYEGLGIEGSVRDHNIRLGSAEFTSAQPVAKQGSTVFVSIDGIVRGYFTIGTSIRPGIAEMISRLGEKCRGLVSGDSTAGGNMVKEIFPEDADLRFGQSPQDKLDYVRDLQSRGHVVTMVGDGLNDAGALRQCDVGIAVTDDTGVFTPASDGIIKGDVMQHLDTFFKLSRSAVNILHAGFVISFLYNVVALSFAVSGQLTPLHAAILMPLSSISVVAFSTIAVRLAGSQKLRAYVKTNAV
jgi:Cu+-exporting ATPase